MGTGEFDTLRQTSIPSGGSGGRGGVEILLGPDYMSRAAQAGPVSRAVSVCRDDFQPGIT